MADDENPLTAFAENAGRYIFPFRETALIWREPIEKVRSAKKREFLRPNVHPDTGALRFQAADLLTGGAILNLADFIGPTTASEHEQCLFLCALQAIEKLRVAQSPEDQKAAYQLIGTLRFVLHRPYVSSPVAKIVETADAADMPMVTTLDEIGDGFVSEIGYGISAPDELGAVVLPLGKMWLGYGWRAGRYLQGRSIGG